MARINQSVGLLDEAAAMTPAQKKALQHALALAAWEELPVFPCSTDKRPTLKGGFHAATKDPAIVKQRWLAHPGELIGAPTGAASGIFILDLDTARHDDAIDWLNENHQRLPLTQSHTTKSGGVHFLYRWVEGLGSTAGKLAIGVDTRGAGGYVIWWPAEGLPVRHHGLIADCPIWLVEALRPKPKPVSSRPIVHQSKAVADAGIDALLRVAASAPKGVKTNCLFWASCRMGERLKAGQISTAEALPLLLTAALRAGWTEREALKHIENGLSTGVA
jgi:hypothetical protein